MDILLKAVLLFGLNFLDAVLTLFWVRHDLAEEGNVLMAHLLELGDGTFITVKALVGLAALLVFYRWGSLPLAQFGLTVALGIYGLLMVVHFLTGITALGF
jgi:hypothetical protein